MTTAWQIGDVRVTPVLETIFALPCDLLFPGATAQDVKAISWIEEPAVNADASINLWVQAFVVEAGGKRIVVDTCMGNDKTRHGGAGHELKTDFLERFEAAGFARDSIDIVLCTHLHLDHVGWNTILEDGRWIPTFPNARYLIGRVEYAHFCAQTEGDDPAILADSVRPLIDHGVVDLIETDHRISPEIYLEATPGHTPGHVSVRIESAGQSGMIGGDIWHSALQIARPDWSAFVDYDPVQSAKTRKGVLEEIADQALLLIGTHFPAPTAGYVRRVGEVYRFDA
jgi:glyoxylase-like metal-dependent hydrolase (beta-lactamase superfamily II)